MRPVLISGPLVSSAIPIGLYWILPGSKLSHASRTFLIVSAWYYGEEEKCNVLKYLQKKTLSKILNYTVVDFDHT